MDLNNRHDNDGIIMQNKKKMRSMISVAIASGEYKKKIFFNQESKQDNLSEIFPSSEGITICFAVSQQAG